MKKADNVVANYSKGNLWYINSGDQHTVADGIKALLNIVEADLLEYHKDLPSQVGIYLNIRVDTGKNESSIG
ncbi:hypothetical protein LCGC14_2196850 [marine sediment metagenome]|uniref:Uncharacterized protein n=1 Tax=marine sediment metagenome TaxID=412755 RepID=A0A0F9GDQ7_9ZZZZ